MEANNSQQLWENAPAFDVEGHRGCRGLLPENTWPAMQQALNLAVTTLEMDAVITKDGQVVLSHEPWFNHEIATKPDGSYIGESEEQRYNIYGMTYDEVRRFDVGLKPHPRFPTQHKMAVAKPLLSDIIDSVRQYMTTARRPFPFFNIETKTVPGGDGVFHPAPAPFVDDIMQVIKAKNLEEQVIIQSFDIRTLQYLHRAYPGIKTSLLMEATDKRPLDEQFASLGFLPTIYSPDISLVTDDLLEQCHRKKVKVIPWTVNDKATIEKLRKMGADGVITDYPNLAF